MENTNKIPKKDKNRGINATRYVVKDILNGLSYLILKNKLMSDEYGIGYKYSKTQSDRIIRAARDLIKKDTEEQLPLLKDEMLARTLDVYAESREKGDRTNALKAIEQINKMFGLYQDRLKIDADVRNEIIIDFGYDKDESAD